VAYVPKRGPDGDQIELPHIRWSRTGGLGWSASRDPDPHRIQTSSGGEVYVAALGTLAGLQRGSPMSLDVRASVTVTLAPCLTNGWDSPRALAVAASVASTTMLPDIDMSGRCSPVGVPVDPPPSAYSITAPLVVRHASTSA